MARLDFGFKISGSNFHVFKISKIISLIFHDVQVFKIDPEILQIYKVWRFWSLENLENLRILTI